MRRPAVPEGARDQLRASFATEVGDRLPRIEAFVDPEAVLRDVHNLASSAWVVGEPELARLARAAEDELRPETLAPLVVALRGWSP